MYVTDFFLHDPTLKSHGAPEHVGFSHLLARSFQGTTGTCVVPITGMNHKVIGQMAGESADIHFSTSDSGQKERREFINVYGIVEYLIVRPMTNYECDMSVSYAKYWNHHREALDVGHRGSGSSYTAEAKYVSLFRIINLYTSHHFY